MFHFRVMRLAGRTFSLGNWPKSAFLLSILLILFLLPFLINSSYYLNFVTEILIFAIVALSLDVILGFVGMISLGHAAFFGIGAYTAGLLSLNLTSNIFLTTGAAVLAAGLAALMVGFLAIKTKGVYFMMVTLTLSQIFFSIAFQWRTVTGGSDGLPSIPRPQLGVFLDVMNSPPGFFYLVLVMFLGSFFLMRKVVSSPFGHALIGIRENESRMEAIGYNSELLKLLSFTIAGGMAGLAGGLNSFFTGFVSPYDLNWTTSALFVFMVVVGGGGNLFGSVVGAAVLLFFRDIVSSYTEWWPIVMGLFFIGFVMIGKGGIVGLSGLLQQKLRPFKKPESQILSGRISKKDLVS